MKLYRGAADLLARLAQRQGRPVTVTFQVTDRCNYQCIHCYPEHTDTGELSFDPGGQRPALVGAADLALILRSYGLVSIDRCARASAPARREPVTDGANRGQ